MRVKIWILLGCVLVQSRGFSAPALSGGDQPPENYDQLKGCEKQAYLWDRIKESTHKNLPDYSPFGATQLVKMSFQDLSVKANRRSDFAPKGWTKYLHRRGAVAKVKIVPKSGQFTGVFQGAECALLRLSLTYKPNNDKPVAPGLALKVLRDGAPSANVSALYSLEGQEKDYNFFKNPMSNIVPTSKNLGQKLVHELFNRYTSYPEELVMEEMASMDSQGAASAPIKAPRQIFFVPGDELNFSSQAHDVRNDFLSIPADKVIYRIYAMPESHDRFNYSSYKLEQINEFVSQSVHIADVVTTSEFIASAFGDEGIFFRHQIRPKAP